MTFFKFPKIETVYKRSTEGTKELIEGDYRDKTVEMLANCKIWRATEKLDGSNHQIHWDGHKLTLGGRTPDSNVPKHVVNYFDDNFNNNETEELFEQLFKDKEFVFYFEAIGHKIQACGDFYDPNNVKFVLLDIYSVSNNSWLSFESISDIARAIGVECKHAVIDKCTLAEAIEYVKSVPMSVFTKSQFPMEGVVCAPEIEMKDSNGERIIVKIKGRDFVPGFDKILKQYKVS